MSSSMYDKIGNVQSITGNSSVRKEDDVRTDVGRRRDNGMQTMTS